MMVCIYPADDGTDNITLELNGEDMTCFMVLTHKELTTIRDDIAMFLNENPQQEYHDDSQAATDR